MNFSYWETEYFNSKSDFTIVGMGLTGLQTAINIAQKYPKAKIVVVDRFAWSLGASTRNAGFACFANVSEILDDLQHENARAVYGLAAKRYKGIQKLRATFGDESIGYAEKGSVEIFTKQNKTDLHKGIDSIQAINSILHEETGLEDVFYYSSKNHLPGMTGGIHNKYEGQLNTGLLYSTIMQKAQALGIELMGGMELESWSKGEIIHLLFKNKAELKTSNLIFCTNAFSHLAEVDKISPARGQVLVTQKLENLPCQGLHVYNQGYYYWRDIDDRILLGGARNIDFEGEHSYAIETNEKVVDELKHFLVEHIVGKEVEIEHQWSGIMAMGSGKEKTPIVKSLETNVFVAARLGGMGVALSSMVSEELIDLLQ